MGKLMLYFFMTALVILQASAFSLSQDIFKGYRMLSSTGNESVIFDYSIHGTEICLIQKVPDGYTREECVCLDKEPSDVCINEKCSMVTYRIPSSLKVSGVENTLNWMDFSSGKFCYSVFNPMANLYLKFGESTITFIGDAEYNSTDYNVTQENSFAHLNLTDDSLVLYMPFDVNNGSDSVTYDYSRYDNDGIVTSAVYNSSGGINESGAYEFDGYGDFINIDSALTPLASTTTGTWAAWVKPSDATPSETKVILGFGDADANTFTHMGIQTDGKFIVDNRPAAARNWIVATDNAVFSDNAWTHVAVVQDGVEPILYVDGVAVPQTFDDDTDKTKWIAGVSGVDNGRIGDLNKNSGGETNHFNGTIDEVSIYNRSLSADEIGDLYNQTLPRFNKSGELVFSHLNFGDNTSVDIVLDDCKTPFNTNISARINDYSEVNFTGCRITDYPLSGDDTNANLTITLQSNNYNTISPLLIGNITLEGTSAPSQTGFSGISISTYAILIILAFSTLAAGICSGSYGKRREIKGEMEIWRDSKIGVTITFLLISAILFLVIAYNSMDIGILHCENQVTKATSISESITTYTNQISCTTQKTSYEELAALFGSLVLFDAALVLVYVFKRM